MGHSCVSGLRCYVQRQSFPVEMLVNRPDILRSSSRDLCQLTDIDYDGVPPFVYPQRVECTVVDMRLD